MPPSHCAAHVGLHGNHVHASADASPALEPAARGAGQADRVASGAVSTPLSSSPGRSTTGHNQGEDTEDPAAAALLPAALLPAAERGSLAPSALPYLLLPLARAQLLPSAVWCPDAAMAHSHTYVMHSHSPLAELRPHTPASGYDAHAMLAAYDASAPTCWAELLPLHAHLPCAPSALTTQNAAATAAQPVASPALAAPSAAVHAPHTPDRWPPAPEPAPGPAPERAAATDAQPVARPALAATAAPQVHSPLAK